MRTGIGWALALCAWPISAVAMSETIDWDLLAQDQNFQFTEPARNRVVWVDSPHTNERPAGMPIDTIVLHHTASSNLRGTIRWFTMPESQVSCHFTIGKSGGIVQMLSTYRRGWHAGASVDAYGRQRVNDFSVGIEIVNMGDGKDPYTEEQLDAVEHVVAMLMRRHPIRAIVSHEFIATPEGRKNDPINFPWERMERFGVPLFYGKMSEWKGPKLPLPLPPLPERPFNKNVKPPQG